MKPIFSTTETRHKRKRVPCVEQRIRAKKSELTLWEAIQFDVKMKQKYNSNTLVHA